MRCIGVRFGMLRHRLDLLGERRRGEVFLPDRTRAASGHDFAGVGGLVIVGGDRQRDQDRGTADRRQFGNGRSRSEEHTSELQSLMRISYAVFCLTKKKE